MVAGTEGYEKFVSRFIEVSQDLDFFEVCKDFIAFLPSKPARILDAGSESKQDRHTWKGKAAFYKGYIRRSLCR